jgi:hypothetical protein
LFLLLRWLVFWRRGDRRLPVPWACTRCSVTSSYIVSHHHTQCHIIRNKLCLGLVSGVPLVCVSTPTPTIWWGWGVTLTLRGCLCVCVCVRVYRCAAHIDTVTLASCHEHFSFFLLFFFFFLFFHTPAGT